LLGAAHAAEQPSGNGSPGEVPSEMIDEAASAAGGDVAVTRGEARP
jgi:hypothetical protein